MIILECYFLPLLLENIRLHALDVYTVLGVFFVVVVFFLLCHLLGGELSGPSLFKFRINFPL